MIEKIYDPQRLDKKATAAVLEVDSSQISRLFASGKIRTYTDTANNFTFTTERDLIRYLSDHRLPNGFVAVPDGENLAQR